MDLCPSTPDLFELLELLELGFKKTGFPLSHAALEALIKFNQAFHQGGALKKSLLVIIIAAVILVFIAMLVGGSSLVLQGLEKAWGTALQSSLMLVASFMVIGQLHVLLTKEKLDKWLGKYSGLKGILISALAGGLFPGGPYIYYPFARSLADKGLPFYILIAFLYGKNIYDFSRIPMEVSLVNPQIALIRLLITLAIPIITGLLAKRLFQHRSVEDVLAREGE